MKLHPKWYSDPKGMYNETVDDAVAAQKQGKLTGQDVRDITDEAARCYRIGIAYKVAKGQK